MKLPAEALTKEQKLEEFDVWITPYLGDIRKTPQFINTLAAIVRAFDRLCEATRDFAHEGELSHGHLAENLVALFAGKPREDVLRILMDLASVLFLITGKSDNNAKCQFPLFLRTGLNRTTLPRGKTSTKKGVQTHQVLQEEPPRTIDSDRYMRWVAGLFHSPAHQRELIDLWLQFVLNEDIYLSQLWSLGKSYAMLKPLMRSEALLNPLVVAQVRGSVAATAGHEPEKILRQVMTEWGLIDSIDFNAADVKLNDEMNIAKEVVQGGQKVKTRAYDFALPYNVPGWGRKVLIQSQYYAGDSGSVSHKNVDQTTAARQEAKNKVSSDARFVEYVDGAGFFASLNGDLKSLLDMPDTASFFQLRSIPIRMRRELQNAGFLTPIEIEHGILIVGTARKNVVAALLAEGYEAEEIDRAIAEAVKHNLIQQPDANTLEVNSSRRKQARRYFLLDMAAIAGKLLTRTETSLSGYVLVPGYGAFYGLKSDELKEAATAKAPTLKTDWRVRGTYEADLSWLAERGYILAPP